MERFAPTVHVPGYRGLSEGYDYTPESWEWILGFALGGCAWAVEEASKPEFRLRILDSLKRRRIISLQGAIEEKLAEVARLREELRLLGGA